MDALMGFEVEIWFVEREIFLPTDVCVRLVKQTSNSGGST